MTQFVKDALVVITMMISIFGAVILSLMIGFDEGRAYSEYIEGKKLDSCNKIIIGNN
jgi:predicted membrane chloride channel (bestrophin family)